MNTTEIPKSARRPHRRRRMENALRALVGRDLHVLVIYLDERPRFSVISKTIFDNTKIPLKVWFKVGYLMLSSKKGMSALQLHRMMHQSAGSEYRTFWYMCHRLRAAMKNMEWDSLMGEVEVDETYVGGRTRTGTHGRRPIRRAGKRLARYR